jgi:hypothetical protein
MTARWNATSLLIALPLLVACSAGAAAGGATQRAATPTSSTSASAGTASTAPAAAAQSGSPAAAAPSTPALSCTESGPASPTFPPAPLQPLSGPPPIVSAAAVGDTLTLTFSTGTPAFEVRTQSDTRFAQDPSGRPVVLAGSSGIRIILRGFRGDRQNFGGEQSMTSSGPLLLQVMQIGDFEGVVTWAAGLSRASCASVTASGSTLTFRFIPESGKG